MQKGTSILELLLVLSITSILIAASTVSISALRDPLAVQFEANRLRLFLERAYTHAVSNEMPNAVSIGGDNVILSSDGSIISTYKVNRRVIFGPPEWLHKPIRFYPTLSASPATITLSTNSYTCSVTLSLRGRTRVVC